MHLAIANIDILSLTVSLGIFYAFDCWKILLVAIAENFLCRLVSESVVWLRELTGVCLFLQVFIWSRKELRAQCGIMLTCNVSNKTLLHCWLKTIIKCFSIVSLYLDGLAVMLLSSDFLQIDSQVFQDSKCVRYLWIVSMLVDLAFLILFIL